MPRSLTAASQYQATSSTERRRSSSIESMPCARMRRVTFARSTYSGVGSQAYSLIGRWTLPCVATADADTNRRMSSPVVTFKSDYVEERSRLTTFFRLIMVIPHAIVWSLWAFVAFFAVVGAWFAIVFTGQYPQGL